MKRRVLIIGDVMLDAYLCGTIERISPEAPVPVLKVVNKKQKIGGAGNVADNLAALDCEVATMFLLGTDSESENMIKTLSENGIKCEWIVQSNNVSAIVKERVVCGTQQIVRLDYNDGFIMCKEDQLKLEQNLETAIKWTDVVVISDYAKGTCSNDLCKKIIKIAQEQNKVIIVDPKGTDWDKYKGASIITPNMNEINLFINNKVLNEDKEIEKSLIDINKVVGVQYVLLTRSEKGMSLIGNNRMVHIAAEKREVFDVTGAGDTVVATLASIIKYDLSNIEEAVKTSNIAAGIVVGKKGTAVVTKDELYGNTYKKIFKSYEKKEIEYYITKWKNRGENIVATSGCFDILHRGHVSLFEKAKSKGDKLIVFLNSDSSVKRLKGDTRPINNEHDRAYVLSSIKCIDMIIIFDPKEDGENYMGDISQDMKNISVEAPMEISRFIKPDIYIKGGDYKECDVPEALYAKKFEAIPFEEGYSTTNTLYKLCEN